MPFARQCMDGDCPGMGTCNHVTDHRVCGNFNCDLRAALGGPEIGGIARRERGAWRKLPG